MCPTRSDDARGRACESPSAGPTDGATSPLRPPEVGTQAGREIRTSSADPADRSDRHISSVLEVPIAWLDLTPPSDPLHLALTETRYAHRVDIWSSGMSTDEQMAWASSQGGWTIRGEQHARSFVVSFSVGSPPAGLAWLARRSSFERLDLHPGGKVHLHLSGPKRDLLEVHRHLGRVTDVKVLCVGSGEERRMQPRGPRLTAAQ